MDLLHKAIHEDFPGIENEVMKLCLNEVNYPMGYSHFDIFNQLSPSSTLSNNITEEIRISYVYMVAYFFALDRLVDSQSDKKIEKILLVPLVVSAYKRLFAIHISSHLDPEILIDEFSRLMMVNTYALLDEEMKHQLPMIVNLKEDFENIYGRAILFEFLYKLVCWHKKEKIFTDVISAIREFLFFMQLGDDLGDWREDFLEKRWTSFLRECFSNIGYIPNNESELEEYVYLSGIYENRAEYVLHGLRHVHEQCLLIKEVNTEFFRDFINQQIDRCNVILGNFVNIKSGNNEVLQFNRVH